MREDKPLGKQSKALMKYRREQLINLIRDYDYLVNKKQIKDEYQKRLREKNIEIPSDSRTYQKDFAYAERIIKTNDKVEIGYTDEPIDEDMHNGFSEFCDLGIQVGKYVRLVIIKDIENETIIFSGSKESSDSLIHQYSESITDIPDESLLHIMLIFSDVGYSQIACNTFKKTDRKHRILYTSSYDTCADVVIQKKDFGFYSLQIPLIWADETMYD